MKIEALEAQFEEDDILQMAPGGALHFTAEDVATAPTEVLAKICGIYQKVRPFLDWTTRFFLIPRKIKAIVTSFIELMDTVCPPIA